MLTEQRGYQQVETLLASPVIQSDKVLRRIFEIIRRDEPSHWAPYQGWLLRNGRRERKLSERLADMWIHRELMFLKLPALFLNPWLPRRVSWADAAEVSPALFAAAV